MEDAHFSPDYMKGENLLYFVPLPCKILISTFKIKNSDLVVKNELCCRLCKNIQF